MNLLGVNRVSVTRKEMLIMIRNQNPELTIDLDSLSDNDLMVIWLTQHAMKWLNQGNTQFKLKNFQRQKQVLFYS